MTPDLYGAWLTAGDRLQPAVHWLAVWWPWLTAAVILAVLGWAHWPPRPTLRERIDQARTRVGMPYLAARWDDDRQAWVNTEPQAAARDNEPGINFALQDECELLIADDPDFAAGCERLWDEIRREQQKGETT